MAATARKAGYSVFGPSDGSRQTPAGKLLRWKTLGVLTKLGSGGIEPVPFLIQWAPESTHPSQTAPSGCELQSLRFEHPDEAGLTAAFRTLGMEAPVKHGQAVRIIATLRTPKGTVELS